MGKTEKIIEERYASHVPGDARRIASIVALTGTREKILDLGCGIGMIGKLIIEKGNTVYGMDFSRGAALKAKKNGLIARAGDISRPLPYKDVFFDGIILAEIIEHIYDTDAFLQNAGKKLKKNGYIIITTPNLATFGRRIMLLLGMNPHIETYFRKDSAGHIRYFIKSTLFQLLADNGFKVEKYMSDEVNFNSSGSIQSSFLAKIFPTLGRSLIIKARKV